MAEITRKKQQVFAGGLSASGNIAIYGSKEAGSPAYSSDLDDIQSTRWLNGILGATSNDKAPYVQDLNAILYTITKQLAYIFQAGVPEWNSQTEYFGFKSLVVYNGKVYVAVSNSTNKNPSTEPTYWLEYIELFAKYMIPSYDSNVASAINGYPEGAILYYNYQGTLMIIRSLVNNNKNTPTNNNIKRPNSEAGTYYWEQVSNVTKDLFLTTTESTIGVDNVNIYLNPLGNVSFKGAKALYFPDTNVTISSNEANTLNVAANSFLINGNPIIRLPDYSTRTQVASADNWEDSYTAEEDGWVYGRLRALAGNLNTYIDINGTRIFGTIIISDVASQVSSASVYTSFLPVKKGDIIKIHNGTVFFFSNR